MPAMPGKTLPSKRRASVSARARKPSDVELPLCIVVVSPPPGVRFCLQRGRDERVCATDSTGADLAFDLSVRVKEPGARTPRLLGPFTQGPPDARFVYVCAGTLAGQAGSCWSRRAKVGLKTITRALIQEVLSHPGSRLRAGIPGTGRDGGPSCATVPLLGGGWEVVHDTSR